MKKLLFLSIICGISLNIKAINYIVTSTDDNIKNPTIGMMRYYVNNALPGDTISFNVAQINLDTTIIINGGKLAIDGNGVIINGTDKFVVFFIKTNVSDLVILNNLTIQNGKGGIMADISAGGNLKINNCSFLNNHSPYNGGGLWIIPSFIQHNGCAVTNSIFIGNSAVQGGALCTDINTSYSVDRVYGNSFINCTFSKNRASSEGAVYAQGNNYFANCLFYDNYDNYSKPVNAVNGEVLDHCASQSSLRGGTSITLYSSPFVEGGFHLNENSYCANAGTPDTVTLGLPLKDIAGNNRIRNGRIDIGAYESNYTATPLRTLYSEIVIKNNSFDVNIENSLLWALAHGAAGCRITFDKDYTIPVSSPILLRIGDLVIDGGNHKITLDGGDSSRIFVLDDGYRITLKGLIIQRGYSAEEGGGIYNNVYTGSWNFVNCTFQFNNARRGGGAYVAYTSFTNCIFKDNKAEEYGGGVFIERESSFINCSFSYNTSIDGGGIYGYSGISSNTFRNCIIYDNTALDRPNIVDSGGKSIFLNCAAKEDLGTNNILLSSSPYAETASHNSFVLKKGSVCINAGTQDTTGLKLPTTDIYGIQRIVNDTVDIGASEYYDLIIGSQVKGHGKITPERAYIFEGSDQVFTFSPDPGFSIDSVIVDNVYNGRVSSYKFENIHENHAVYASFKADTFQVIANNEGNGAVSPSKILMTPLDTQTFIITPNTGFKIDKASLNRNNILDKLILTGNDYTYTLTNVTSNDTLLFSFIISTFIKQVKDNGITVYPNPTDGIINFTFSENFKTCDLSLIDVSGKKVYYNSGFNGSQLDISYLPLGNYFLRLVLNDKVICFMIIKK